MIRTALESLATMGIPLAPRGEQPIDDPPPDRRLASGVRHSCADRSWRCRCTRSCAMVTLSGS
jgi:hypothetical protein